MAGTFFFGSVFVGVEGLLLIATSFFDFDFEEEAEAGEDVTCLLAGEDASVSLELLSSEEVSTVFAFCFALPLSLGLVTTLSTPLGVCGACGFEASFESSAALTLTRTVGLTFSVITLETSSCFALFTLTNCSGEKMYGCSSLLYFALMSSAATVMYSGSLTSSFFPKLIHFATYDAVPMIR